ncbi:hypothetical protein ACOMHN_007192 [Nucella lapillus]
MTNVCRPLHVALAVVCLVLHVPGTVGHGRLMDPPSRSSLWRLDFNSPPNYDDNQLFCGGFSVQWERYEGKCGLCGDPWPGPRDNEAGGKYATGIISRAYQPGQVIEVYVQLTANHKGYFEFRLCQHENPLTNITQACLDQHVLVDDGTGLTRYTVPVGGYQSTQHLRIKLRLPRGLTCAACVLQWKYNAGNSWGVDPDTQRGCIGCGPQEQFYGCADVAVGHDEVVTGVPPDRFPWNTSPKPSTGRPGERPQSSSKEEVAATTSAGTTEEWHFGIANVFGSAGGKASAASSLESESYLRRVGITVMLMCGWCAVFFPL